MAWPQVSYEDRVEQILNRFEEDENGCYIWQGYVHPNGYGRLRLGGRTWGTHRLAYELLVGELPEGKWVLHHCDVKLCGNPDHLYAGTPSDNLQDAYDRGRRVPYWLGKRGPNYIGDVWPHRPESVLERSDRAKDLKTLGFHNRAIIRLLGSS